MNINNIHEELVSILKSSGNEDVVVGIEQASIGATTGSEALGMTWGYLQSLKSNHPVVFKLIQEQIADYKKYCRKHGLILRE